MQFLMPPHPLTNFEIQKYCQNQDSMEFSQEIICLKNKGWKMH